MEKEMIRFEKFDLPIKVHQISMKEGDTYRGMHSHRAVEIVEVTGGVLNCRVNDEVLTLCPGQIIFINGNVGHRLYAQDAEISYLNVDVGLLEEKTDDEFAILHSFISHTQAKPYAVFDDNQEITELLGKISTKYLDDKKASRWYLKGYLYELVAFMYEQAFVAPASISNDHIRKIEQVVRFVNSNYQQPITLDDICAAVKYSKYTVCHTFKAATGSTVFEYVNFIRVHHAVARLRQKSGSVLEIATECGFSSATYFIRVFKSVFGCAPSVYRKLLTEKQGP